MESLTAVTGQMKPTVTVLVENMLSNVSLLDVVSLTHGNVTEMTTVPMALMKTRMNVIIENVILRPSISVKMESVSPNFGSVITRMTVETNQTNQPIDVGTETARQDGRSVLLEVTTDASLPGCFATAKMTAGMVPTNQTQSTVRSAVMQETSSARMVDVSLFDGDAISKMTVETTRTKRVLCAQTSTENVLRVSFNVETRSVSLPDGDVIMMTTVMMDRMKKIVMITSASLTSSSVDQVTVSLEDSFAMDIRIVEMYLMR